MYVRFAIVLNGKETLHEALVKHFLDFSDRPEVYTNAKVFNIHRKGNALAYLLFSLLPAVVAVAIIVINVNKKLSYTA